jgi:hypothetical protein
MAYVVNFIGILPPPRYDENPWTKALVYECATEEGEFLLVDTIELASLPGGLDTEPEEPKARDLTINNAALAEAWYIFIFEDAGKKESGKTVPIQNAVSVESSIRPSLEDLGALLRVRTVVEGSAGVELGTFNTKTRPTAAEAQYLIDQAVNQTILTTGPDIAPKFWQQAKTVVLYLTAQLVELSFYKNEIDKGISAYPAYEKMYEAAIDGLINSIQGNTAASPTQSFFTVPIVTKSQARFAALQNAINPTTGLLEPEKLPPDMNWPLGPGGFPKWFYEAVNGWPNAVDFGGWWYNSDSFLNEY